MFSKLSHLFKSKNQSNIEPILVVEIESGSVACALVLINHADKVCPIIKYYNRQNFSYDPKSSGENSRDFFNLLFSTIEKSIGLIFKQIKKDERPVAIHCFSGSPLYLSQTQHIKLEEDAPFKITPHLVKQLIDDQITKLTEKFSITNTDFSSDQADVVESKLIKIYANDYEVPNPYKVRAKKIEVVHFCSIVSGKVTKRIESILAGFYPDLSVNWHSIAFALFNSININPKSLPNLMLVSTGGLNTEIIIIKDRVISEIVSIPFGEDTIVQNLQKALNRSAAEIRSMFALQSSVGMNLNSKTYLTPHLEQIKTGWNTNFRQGIQALTNNSFLPTNLLVVGHGSLCEIISSWIGAEDFTKTTRSQSAIQSTSLSSDYFGNKCVYEGDSDAAKDIHLMAEIIFCDTLIKQGQIL